GSRRDRVIGTEIVGVDDEQAGVRREPEQLVGTRCRHASLLAEACGRARSSVPGSVGVKRDIGHRAAKGLLERGRWAKKKSRRTSAPTHLTRLTQSGTSPRNARRLRCDT